MHRVGVSSSFDHVGWSTYKCQSSDEIMPNLKIPRKCVRKEGA